MLVRNNYAVRLFSLKIEMRKLRYSTLAFFPDIKEYRCVCNFTLYCTFGQFDFRSEASELNFSNVISCAGTLNAVRAKYSAKSRLCSTLPNISFVPDVFVNKGIQEKIVKACTTPADQTRAKMEQVVGRSTTTTSNANVRAVSPLL